jgi:hypothetical protein
MSEPPPWDASGQQDSGQYPAQAPYRHIPEGIGVTAGQIGLLQPALARPGRLNAGVLAAGQLEPVTIEVLLLARSGLWLRGAV